MSAPSSALLLPADNTSSQIEASIVQDIASLNLGKEQDEQEQQQHQHQDCAMDSNITTETKEAISTTVAPSPRPSSVSVSSTTAITVPSSSQVFAPKPIRATFPPLYRPIPQRLTKGALGQGQLDDSPIARSPSPVPSLVLQRRSSSAASTAEGWNLMSMKLESRLAEATMAAEAIAEANAAEEDDSLSTGETKSLLQLYSPSKDVLDELYKIIRNGKSYPFSNFRELSTNSTSPLYRTRTPTKTPSSPSQHRRQISDATTPDGSLMPRTPDREWSKIVFPSSPISRTSMRNPILFNSQFAAGEFLQKMQSS